MPVGNHFNAKSEYSRNGCLRDRNIDPKMNMNQTPINAPEHTQAAPVEIHSNSTRPIRILVADDDIYTRTTEAVALIRSGYHVNTAEDGVAAWQALNDDRYDLLITDHQMPKVTGLELIQKLRSESRGLPVILVSGMIPVEELERHPELRIEATLQKPCGLDVLLETIRRVLGEAVRS